MEKRNDNGFIHIIIYLLIFLVFCFTVLACLDILDLIDLPEEYSVSAILDKFSEKVIIEEIEGTDSKNVEDIVKNIKIQIEDEKESNLNIFSPEVEGYKSSKEVVVNEKLTKDDKFLYYNQLDEYGKIIYDELEKNLENMKSGVYNVSFGTTFNDLLHEEDGEIILNNSFQLAINALNFDNPNLFYIDIPKLYLLTKITTKLWITTYEVEIGASQGKSYLNSQFPTKESVDEAINKIENEKAMIKSRVSGNIENQIKTVHDYLIEKIEYDSTLSKENIYNVYGALINKCTVCEGYARAFKSIMDDLNIPCVIACGTAINSKGETENHAWNYVEINDNWYAIDVTWDDPIIIGNGYVDKSINYKYYLKGSNDFFLNHTEKGDIVGDARFIYPTLSYSNY